MLAGKPFSGPAKTGIDLIDQEQSAILIAQLAKQGQKLPGRNVYAAAHLNRLDQDRANLFAPKQVPDFDAERCQFPGGFWKGHKMAELTQLTAKRGAKVLAMRGIQG